MKLNACLEDLHGLLPVEVVVGNESGHAPFEIMKSVLMMIAVATSLFVKIPILCQFPDIIVIRSIMLSYRRIWSPLRRLVKSQQKVL